ncbi:hypothetical protein AVEN_224199-1 [Araneus ventricosus]|uniref:Uncharacterized protein n=1 Tax=Araneus ventricosus TaxID=182803 RepID=A0A4Y2EJV0_ARAVE|nr:hypothetical protein AVEN_224199-1 [Araneus ventricosus]
MCILGRPSALGGTRQTSFGEKQVMLKIPHSSSLSKLTKKPVRIHPSTCAPSNKSSPTSDLRNVLEENPLKRDNSRARAAPGASLLRSLPGHPIGPFVAPGRVDQSRGYR